MRDLQFVLERLAVIFSFIFLFLAVFGSFHIFAEACALTSEHRRVGELIVIPVAAMVTSAVVLLFVASDLLKSPSLLLSAILVSIGLPVLLSAWFTSTCVT